MDERELAYVERVGRYQSEQYGLAPVVGRVAGYLLICDPPRQTIDEIATALKASRSAVSDAVALLEKGFSVVRSRTAGERADRVSMNPAAWEASLGSPEFSDLAKLAHEGLELLGESPRSGRLQELAAFAEFFAERGQELAAEWIAHREALRASGDLPEDPLATS